ncbi:hypothetical protein Godav_014214 [Gossypium davidsonii]|uniref:Uncharacterized protein n=1 Tax=Gossypium davidsonii TaxID=34287 RepID=A0A7J8RKH1_GOSDV|nr:hypothetical protein [Gossypium davidsonii]
MTMVPAENLPKQHHLPHGGGGGFYGYCGSSYTESFGLMSRVYGYDFHAEAYVGSDLAANRMAEDESTTNSLNEAGSNSKDNNQELELERDEGWLQLGLGGQPTRYDDNKHYQGDPTARRGGMIELDLLPGGMSQQARPLLGPIFHMPDFRAPPPPPPLLMHSFSSSLFFQHQQGSSSTFPHHGELSSSFRPIAQNIAAAPSASSSSSSSSLVPLGSYFARPFQVQSEMDVAGPSSDVRIIDPPRRPHSGIWFMLQASQNQ